MGNATVIPKENNVRSSTAQVIPFRFEAREVRTCVIDDQPWFAAHDILTSLGYAVTFKPSKAMAGVPEQWKGVYPIHTLGGAQKLLMLSEQGLYFFLGRSDKQKALPFQMWLAGEVLPTIRKHGTYTDTHNKMGTLIGETIGTNGFNMLGALIKGKVVSLPAHTQRKASSKIWSQTHAAFGVRSAADIPASQLDAARNFIAAYALEGEWLPPIQQGAELDEHSASNLRALCHHADWLLRNWNATLEPALRQVQSPLAASFHEHFVSAATLGRSLVGTQKLAG